MRFSLKSPSSAPSEISRRFETAFAGSEKPFPARYWESPSSPDMIDSRISISEDRIPSEMEILNCLMPVELVVGMDVAVGSAAVGMDVFVDQVHLQQEFLIGKHCVRRADLLNFVLFGEHRDSTV